MVLLPMAAITSRQNTKTGDLKALGNEQNWREWTLERRKKHGVNYPFYSFQTEDNQVRTAQGNSNSNRKPAVLAWRTRGQMGVTTQVGNPEESPQLFPKSWKILILKIHEIISYSVYHNTNKQWITFPLQGYTKSFSSFLWKQNGIKINSWFITITNQYTMTYISILCILWSISIT